MSTVAFAACVCWTPACCVQSQAAESKPRFVYFTVTGKAIVCTLHGRTGVGSPPGAARTLRWWGILLNSVTVTFHPRPHDTVSRNATYLLTLYSLMLERRRGCPRPPAAPRTKPAKDPIDPLSLHSSGSTVDAIRSQTRTTRVLTSFPPGDA